MPPLRVLSIPERTDLNPIMGPGFVGPFDGVFLVEGDLGAAPCLIFNAKAPRGLVRSEAGGGDVRADADMQVLLVERAALDDRLAGVELNGRRAG